MTATYLPIFISEFQPRFSTLIFPLFFPKTIFLTYIRFDSLKQIDRNFHFDEPQVEITRIFLIPNAFFLSFYITANGPLLSIRLLFFKAVCEKMTNSSLEDRPLLQQVFRGLSVYANFR